MDERPRSPLLSILLFPLALALMVPFLAVLLAWFYLGAALHALWLAMVRLFQAKTPAPSVLQPPHFSQVVSKRVTTDLPRN